MYEDKLLLKIRVERLKGNRTFSQKPKSRCHHVLQTPQVDSRDEAANEYVTWTPMHYVETRLDEQTLYAAWATHTWPMVDGALQDQAEAGRPRQLRRRASATFSCSCESECSSRTKPRQPSSRRSPRAAARHADKPFSRFCPRRPQAYGIAAGEITYRAALRAGSHALIDAYRAEGYGAGHRVGILMENRPSFFLHWFALNALGVSLVPINPDLRAAELEYLIGHSEIVAAVVIPSRQARRRSRGQGHRARHPRRWTGRRAAPRSDAPAPSRARPIATANAPCSTPPAPPAGRRAACCRTNISSARGEWYASVGGLIALQCGTERMLTPLPVFHMNAMAYSAMAMVMTGGCLIALDRFHPKSWWAQRRASRATIVHYLGVMPAMLMGAPRQRRLTRATACASASAPASTGRCTIRSRRGSVFR